MPLPANGAPATETGLPNLVAGLPNTATAATLSARLNGRGGADPTSPTLSPSGGMPISMSTTAAPWEYPPSTNRVAGQRIDMVAMWLVASRAPSAAARKS